MVSVMKANRSIPCLLAAAALGVAVCIGSAGSPWAQERTPRIWDVSFGTHVRGLPADAFLDPSCGTNGGPPSLRLDSFEEFGKCPVEAETGLREVWFIYDDTLEYVGLARREMASYRATSILDQPVILSLLIGDDGRVRGYRIFTDPRAEPALRMEAHGIAVAFRGRLGPSGWQCEDLPRLEGESPIEGLFVKRRCEKDAGGLHAVVEAHAYFRPGQAGLDPFNNRPRPNEFESSAWVESIQVAPLPPLPPDAADVAAAEAASAVYGSPREAFLAGAASDCPGCDLYEADLRRRDLQGANLEGANLEGAILHRADLRGANLSGARLYGANLNRADLTFAVLRDAELSYAMLYQADAARADFTGANLNYASLIKGRLTLAVLEDANFEFADLGEARLNDARMARATLIDANLLLAVLIRADMQEVDADGARLVEADLRGADLRNATVRYADLTAANLAESDLSNADFSGSRLQSTNLHDAIQTGTSFDGAIMPGEAFR